MKGHDRYLIYRLLGRSVEIRMPVRLGGQRLKGTVDKVFRDIFNGQVSVTISGDIHHFREPRAIVKEGGSIHFIYGDVEQVDEEDVPHYNPYEEHLNQHLKRTARCPVSTTIFKLGKLTKSPRSRWRSRVAV